MPSDRRHESVIYRIQFIIVSLYLSPDTANKRIMKFESGDAVPVQLHPGMVHYTAVPHRDRASVRCIVFDFDL